MTKVWEALAFWRMAPRQIASDLRRFFHCTIGDWHQGRLSSFDLLEMFGVTIIDDPDTETRTVEIEFAPEDGAVADLVRDGERPEWKRMLAQVANISAIFRAAKFPNADSEHYGEQVFYPVSQIKQFVEDISVIESGGAVILFPGEE